jgi:squalene-associated FAD-dependent desaturase
MSQVHVIGAGLAGLSAGLAVQQAGRSVAIYESGSVAGGRCRSYFDRELGLRVDNGNHLLLSGNRSTFAYVKTIGAEDRFGGPQQPVFPFIDLKTGDRWTVRPNLGRVPWWIFAAGRRVPDTRLSDYIGLMRLAQVTDDRVVADAMRRGRLYWRLVEPFAIAALNTRPQQGLARLLGAVIRETLARGGSACLPRFPREGLSEALIDPALAHLRERDASIHFNRRVTGLRIDGGRVVAMQTSEGPIDIAADDAVVLAVPPWAAVDLLPQLVAPTEFEGIVNVHFRHEPGADNPAAEAGFVGILEGVAEWVFVKAGHVSVTISAANAMLDDPARQLATAVWPNVCAALSIPYVANEALPPFRVVKERRATFAATAAQEVRRPPARTPLPNLVLAGDWTATGLPATIEGAIRSGRTAADALLGR